MATGAVTQQVDLVEIRSELSLVGQVRDELHGIGDVLKSLRPASRTPQTPIRRHPHRQAVTREVLGNLCHVAGIGTVAPGATVNHDGDRMGRVDRTVGPFGGVGDEEPPGLTFFVLTPGQAPAINRLTGATVSGSGLRIRQLEWNGCGQAQCQATSDHDAPGTSEQVPTGQAHGPVTTGRSWGSWVSRPQSDHDPS